MTIDTQLDTTISTDSRRERLARRTAELFAHDDQFADAAPRPEVSRAASAPGLRLAEVVDTILTGYSDRPALGQRSREFVTNPETGRTEMRLIDAFETTTYGDLQHRVAAIARSWSDDIDSVAGTFVAILGFTSSDYTALDLACMRLGAVSVPLQTSAPAAQLAPIIAEVAPTVFAVSIDQLGTAVDAILAGTAPDRVVVFDYHPQDDDQRDTFDTARDRLPGAVVLESLADVIERGSAGDPPPLFVPDETDNPLATIFYTSGSTGAPKGAMYTERMLVTPWLPSTLLHRRHDDVVPAIHINFMPMSHLYGRYWLAMTLASGGTAFFAAKSDLSTLFDDIALVRPTAFNFVPRVCDMVFQQFRSEVDRRTREGAGGDELESQVKADIRENFLGGRVLAAMSGTAPLSAEMGEFISSCLDLDLGDGYGSTEAGMVLVESKIQRPPVIDYKLVDVPELGYFATDTPHPRGELLLKTDSMFPGYYKRPEITAEMFDADGYYMTGDVMAEVGPDELVYVDRRKNVLKLSQGEFVAVSKLEADYVNSPLVRQIFVYGNSSRSYLLAVVVPTESDVDKDAVLLSLQSIATAEGLNSYEIPRDLLIETEPFTQDNGLLSGVGKLLRPKLKDHYGDRLEELYARLADGQDREMQSLRTSDPDGPALDIVCRAARALLGCAESEAVPDAHFTDLGGDSLSALTFSTLLHDIFDVEVPVGVIVSAANDLAHLADYIENERRSGAARPSFASVHGAGSTRVSAADLTLDKFIDDETLRAATSLPRPTGEPRTVLLTGGNGYLGRFLCLEWLERVAKTGGTVIALVRGADAAAARRRLDEAFDSGDEALRTHFADLADKHLEVLAGDIGDDNLGLDAQTWKRLADSVDLIVHPAALVNHVLPYNQMFGPNVVGTAELIRMAITSKIKPVDYLSTVAVASQIDPAAFEEDGDIRAVSAERSVDDSYANGYGNSKWGGEVLLREAHDLCGLPVAVFRSDMILAHSTYGGQLNVPDVFTRLILSVVATGIAPASFYTGDPSRAHYDGLPADFTAAAIAELGGPITEGYVTYDVLNPHDDGISLDTFVDWLIDAGYPITRIDDYDEWFARLDTAIRAMPEKQKQHSLLPLMHAYAAPAEPTPGSAVPAEVFRSAVRHNEIGVERDIPHLSRNLIVKYVTDLKKLQLL
ncbi:carboxylic acid reductase [Actinomycetes bacterium M1A6_2h]